LNNARRRTAPLALLAGFAGAALAGMTFIGAAPAGAAPAPEATTPAEAPRQFELRPFTARYAFTWHGLQAGTATFTLRQLSPGEWLYESTTEPRGLFRLVSAARARVSSRMTIGPEGVLPRHFEGTEGTAQAPGAVLDFDWEALRVRGHMQEDAVDMALRPGVQDDLSVMVSLLYALGRGNLPAGTALFDKNGIRDYAYTHAGTATLDTAVGPLATEIYRSQRAGSPRHNLYWCATQYGDVPVRAEQHRGNELEWRMELLAIERDPGP
jgi:hypothetical protein